MSPSLSQRLADDIKIAMRARDSVRLGTLRLVQAAIKSREIELQRTLSDDEILQILDKQVKQRRESIHAFEQAGRNDSAAQEQAEIDVLQDYLPAQATEAEIQTLIDEAIATTNAQGVTGPAAMGKIMGIVRPKLAGRADMAQVSAQIKQRLS